MTRIRESLDDDEKSGAPEAQLFFCTLESGENPSLLGRLSVTIHRYQTRYQSKSVERN